MRQVLQATEIDVCEYCRQVTQRASKTFYWGSLFLVPARRQAIWAVYAFCRVVDDIVDEASGETAATPQIGHLAGYETPEAALDYWRTALQRLYSYGETSGEPILSAWRSMLEQYQVPLKPALELIDGVAMDLDCRRYETFDELALYCYRVAGTVGLLTAPIFGYQDESALTQAVDLGIALQLTNILRDIGEDARRDRIYLPQEDLLRFGYSEDELLRGIINDPFRALMHFEMERAEEYYQRGLPGIELLSADCRLAVRLSGTLYRRILERISANNYDVFTMRASVSLPTRLMTVSTQWFMQQFLSHMHA